MHPHPLVVWIGVALIAALAIWLLQQLPLDPSIVRIIRAVIIFVVAAWLISAIWAMLFGAPLLPMLR